MEKRLLVDFFNRKLGIAFCENQAKIDNNLRHLPEIANFVKTGFDSDKDNITLVMECGRYILIYSEDKSGESKSMSFFDYRVNLTDLKRLGAISDNRFYLAEQVQGKINQMALINKYVVENEIELFCAEPYEIILEDDFFSCYNDEIVIKRAKELGVYVIINNLNPGEMVRVALVDEIEVINNAKFKNVYAFAHFGNHPDVKKEENGYTYVRLRNVQENTSKLDKFFQVVDAMGCSKYDKDFWIERLAKERHN